MACGTLLQSGLHVQRAGRALRRRAGRRRRQQNATVDAGTESEDTVPLFERARVDAALVARVAAVPGVAPRDRRRRRSRRSCSARAAIVDGPGGHPTAVHPWGSAALTPYALRAGHAPAGAGELVVDAGLARRGGLHVGARVRLASNGPARVDDRRRHRHHPARRVERQGVLFVTDAEAARLAAAPGRVDAIGVLPAPGADRGALR